jgi:hypothetical protein
MIREALALAIVAASTAGCMSRTELKVEHKRPDPAPVYVGDRSCMVRDFEFATDLPEGSKNLGFVTVAEVQTEGKDDDEATYVAVRKKICEMGGDALSQAAWIREMDDEHPKLKVNAWALP